MNGGSGEALVRVAGLTVGPAGGGPPVLRDATLTLAPGRVLGVAGRSGSGKSSLALSLLGHVRPGLERRSGTVRVGGLDPFARAGARRLRGRVVSFMGQEPAASLNPALGIGAQVAEAVRLRSPGTADVTGQVRALLAAVGLPSDRAFLRRRPHQVSGGQAQRVALAAALAGAPRLLVLDEPTGSLDTVLAHRMRELVAEVLRDGERAAVVVSHDTGWLAALADAVIRLDGGRITATGPPAVPRAGRPRVPPSAMGAQRPSGPEADRTRVPQVTTPPDASRVPPPVGHGDAGVAGAGETRAGLVVRGLSAAHGRVTVLRDVSLTVPGGTCTALVGPSGSGKTTLARCLAGLHPLTRGTAGWRDEPGRPPGRTRAVQLVPQDVGGALNPRESVRTTLTRPMTGLRGMPAEDAAAEAARLLGLVGLSPAMMPRRPGELSGGERQRVTVARALAGAPRALVCDEVTSALDREVASEVLDLLASLRRALGLTLLLVTHDLAAAARYADRVVVLDGGTVVESGPPDRVLSRPEHAVTRELVACSGANRAK
ncbi:ABC transporter ATP-binding protein [Sphaerisporangium album]|uniref:ABC transporter ATP-binding protein n=1 Tax=Sphaerisporangium album TaxID=509200 RepID=A0A367FFG9_9ACTN|nr:ATP-binding cassette domain-containing protein [Sphaerisporangium album]RCG28572.1 ABC transporter ATP-binding protein [Sphaerisporangium album]